MRKVNCVIAAVLLVFNLTACGGNDGTVQERLSAGEKVLVGFVIESIQDLYLMEQANYLKSEFEKIGVTLEYLSADGNEEIMAAHIEDYIAAKADLIMCTTHEALAVKAALIKARRAGIPVITVGDKPDYAGELSGGIYRDWEESGYELGKMASAWINERFPNAGNGQIHAANLTNSNQERFVALNEGLLRAISEDLRIAVTYTQNDVSSQSSGYDAAESALANDPEIKLILSYGEGSALGASNYIKTLQTEDINFSDYACFAVGRQRTGIDEITRSKTNVSLYRGSIAFGVYDASGNSITSAEALYKLANAILQGKVSKSDETWYEDDRWAVTSFGYQYLYDNPNNSSISNIGK